MSTENILTQCTEQGLGIITINRPKVLNAIDWETFFQLQAAVEAFIADDKVRIIILTGAGERAFISGGDIGEELKMDGLTSYRWSRTGHKLCTTLETCTKPVIAAVQGYCLGGGFEIALACDFILCTENAKFGGPETKLGVVCGFGGNIRLPRRVGRAQAKELLMTGAMLDSAEAYRLCLVNRVFENGTLMEGVETFCRPLLAKNDIVLDLVKRSVNYGCEIDLNSAIQMDTAIFGVVSATQDKVEGMTAFLEKRPPNFTNQ